MHKLPITSSIPTKIYLPDIGNAQVEVTEILVKAGDYIDVEQTILIVEGGKASMEIPAPIAGQIVELMIQIGDKIDSGALLMTCNIPDTNINASVDREITSVSTVHHTPHTKNESYNGSDQVIKPVQTSSISIKAEGDLKKNAHASPLIRRIAREHGIDLDQLVGTGRRGRILQEDIHTYIKQYGQKSNTKQDSTLGSSNTLDVTQLNLPPWPPLDVSPTDAIEYVNLKHTQQVCGATLHRNWLMIPHVTQWDNADITELETFRQQQNHEYAQQKSNRKLTILAFVVHAVVRALKLFPKFNSSLSPDQKQLILKHQFNIGIAVDTPHGLVVPVIHNAADKRVGELADMIADRAQRARRSQLTPAEMQDGTFTISSLGGIGGHAFTPIINAPQAAILGLSRAELKPWWDGKTFVPRLLLPLSLSYDHRIVNGADGARFTAMLCSFLADLRRLLL